MQEMFFKQDSMDIWRVCMPGPVVIKLFSCTTQLGMKFKLLINVKIAKINGIFRFKSPVIYLIDKYLNLCQVMLAF